MKKNYPKNSLLSGLKFLKSSLNQTKTVRLLFLILFSCLLGNVVEAQTTITSTGNTDWNTASTWNPAIVPGPSDNVIIKSGHTVTVTASASAASVTFDNNATATSNLTVNSGVTLTITGAVTLRNAANSNTAATISGAGTLLCGSLLIGSPLVNTANKAGKKQNILSLKISTLKVSGNITLNNDDQGGGDSSQPVLDISGTCVLSANSVVFTHSGGGGGGASENIFNLGSGATLDLSSSVPFLVKYDDVALKDSHITINLKSGSKVNFGCGVTPPTRLANGGGGGIDKDGGPTISYTGVTVGSSAGAGTVTASITSICSGASTIITVSSSSSTTTYQLRNGTTAVGASVLGTGGTITLPTGSLAATTTFNVLAANSDGGCSFQLTNTPTITVSSAPIPTVSVTEVSCSNGSDGSIIVAGLSVPLEFKNTDNDYVDLGSPLLSGKSMFTVEGFLKFKKADIIGSRISLFGQNDVVEFFFDDLNTITIYTVGGGRVSTPLTASFGNDEWHHIAATGDGANLKIYIDGVLKVTGGTSTGNYGSSSDNAKIGSGVVDASGGGFTGQMKKVGFYSTALTAATIASLAASPTTYLGTETGMIAGYNFFEGTGTKLNSLPSGRDGTFINSPTWVSVYNYSWTKTGVPAFSKATKDIDGLSPGEYNLSVSGVSCSWSFSYNLDVANIITTWKNLGTGNIGWDNGVPTLNNNIVFAADYSLDADVNGCSCQVTGDKIVTIKAGKTMKIVNDVKVLGTLIFENNASLVQINDEAVNTGSIIYKRTTGDISNTDYVYWSTPVAAAKLAAIQTGTLYYSFNASANSWVRQSASSVMLNGIGYIVRGAGTGSDNGTPFSKTASFIGKPNNGVKNVVISAERSNLIGNPYPSAIDADAFIIKNNEVLSGSLYFWTHKTAIQLATNITNGSAGSGAFAYTSDDYATYNLTGGTGTSTSAKANSDPNGTAPSGKIAAGQAFFATGSKDGTAIFNNSMRVSGGLLGVNNAQFFKVKSNSKESSSIEKNRVWLNLTNTQGAFKQTLIGYITGSTNDYESAYDGESLNANAFIDFYSVQNNSNYAIQGRALPFEDNDVVPLGFKTTIAGEFKIGIDKVDGLLASKKIFIEDKLLGKVQDLSEASYDFTTETGTFDDRFVLSYANKTIEVIDNIVEKKFGVLIYNKNKEIVVESSDGVIDKVLIYDFLGKQVYRNTNINETDLKVSNLILINNQALIIKVILQNGETITKKIIL